MALGSYRYYVYFTPLEDVDSLTYGTELDVSDRIEVAGISSIKRSIDASDYDIGVFTFDEITLRGFNYNGYFNDQNDIRSIFRETRDRCKVRVVFQKETIVRGSNTITSDTYEDTITFRGIINEEGTRLDIVNETITFKVLSRDSVLRNTKISAGVVANAQLASDAIYQILNVPKITSVLTVSQANINLDTDYVIDVGTYFDNKSVNEALNQLLFAANSVLIVNDAGEIIVQSRLENSIDILNLYGKSDEYGRENIINISEYNSGMHRMFTSVNLNGIVKENAAFSQAYGYRQKKFQLDFITNDVTEATLASRLVNEFKFPKIEMVVRVSTDTAKDVKILDPISINWPLRVKPIEGKFLPVVGVTAIGDSDMPLPYRFGALEIAPRIAFKVISIDENPEAFTTDLKVRQTGVSFDDGYFDNPASSIVGYAVVGIAKIKGTADPCDTYNPSAVGAASVGCTMVA